MSLAVTAVRHGASAANYVEVLKLLKEEIDGREVVCGARVKDTLTDKEWDVKAKCVINATGPYTDRIRMMADECTPKICQPSSGVHVVLPDYYRYLFLLIKSCCNALVYFRKQQISEQVDVCC